jgi:Pro-kumamolisin, activation domain
MNRLLRRKVAFGALIALTLLAALVAVPLVNSHFTSHAASGRWTVRGHLVPAVHGRHALSQQPDLAQALDLSIALSLRNQSALTQLIAKQNDRHSGLYHQYLSSREFLARFAPTQATVNRVIAWLRSQGLLVHSVAANHLLIDASGSLATIEQAFQTTLATYQVNGRTVYAPTTEPSVPDALTGLIVNIGGLDDVGTYTHAPIVRSKNISPRVGPGGGYAPTDLRTAYDLNSLISSANGTGQTVAIFELDGYKASDVNSYLSYYGLGSPKYSNVLVDGVTNIAGSGAIEVELDMEVVSAIAPGASQKVYIGPNTAQGVIDTYNRIVTDNIAKVTSTSWGLCEFYLGTSELQALDNVFSQGAAQGQAFFAASGDAGAYDCGDTNLGVDSPADDPHVVGVGGTNLQTGSGGSYMGESVWWDPWDTWRGPYGTGSGGGLSGYFAQPSYQVGPGVINSYSNGMRQVPDVSADADPNTGYSVYCSVTAAGCSPSTPWIMVGGTSAAAPLWAGIAADLNQYLIAHSKPTLGSASAALYRLFNTSQTYTAYHDITINNNLYYPATTGYDLATGIGTPDVWNMARDLATGSIVNDFSISTNPSVLLAQQGGNNSATINTAVTSGVAGTITLSATVSPPGPTTLISPTSITVGSSATITVNVGPTIPAGNYSVSVQGTEGMISRATILTITVIAGSGNAITNGGFEAGDLSGWTSTGITASSMNTKRGGSYSARVGSISPYRGDSSLSQTFTVPNGYGSLTFWYRLDCPDTVNFDWVIATLTDNSSGTSPNTLLGKTCYNDGLWHPVSSPVTVGHSYTLTIVDHDDNYPTDPTYTFVDDVTLSATVSAGFINGDFESGISTGWRSTGQVDNSNGDAHSGSVAAVVGSFQYDVANDSFISQTVSAPAGATTLSFWYKVVCTDSVVYDWATATLKDNTADAMNNVLLHTCTNNGKWVEVTASVIAGHSYTLTLSNHDDGWPGDPTYTLYDDVAIS